MFVHFPVTKPAEPPRKNNEPATTPNKPAAQENSKSAPHKKAATPKVSSKPAGNPVKAATPVNKPAGNSVKASIPVNKPAGNSVKAPTNKSAGNAVKAPTPVNKPTVNPVKAATPVNKPAGNPVKATSTAQLDSKLTDSNHLSQSVPVVNSASPEPSRSESPSVTASRMSKHITKWNVPEVVDFIKTTDCNRFADDFLKQVRNILGVFMFKIDGTVNFFLQLIIVTIHMKATEQYKVVPTFDSLDEILKCDHSSESYRALLACGTVNYAKQGSSDL